jgi:hypothetical protein
VSRKKKSDEVQACPVGRFFQELDKAFGPRSEMRRHFSRSQLEILKALRSFVDARIEHIEKQQSSQRKRKSAKIEVE